MRALDVVRGIADDEHFRRAQAGQLRLRHLQRAADDVGARLDAGGEGTDEGPIGRLVPPWFPARKNSVSP